MNSLVPYLFLVILLLGSCREHQPTNIPAPDPRLEIFTFDQLFMELALDQAGTPWLRTDEYVDSVWDPLSSFAPFTNSIYRFTGDSLDLVYAELPILGHFLFDRTDQLWATTAKALIRITEGGIDTVFAGTAFINTLLVDVHNNLWITPAGNGIIKISEHGQEIFNVENSRILSDYVSCSSIDQSNTKWFGHIKSGISRISDIGSVHIIEDFIDQNIYALAPGNSLNMLAGMGWNNNDTILVIIGNGPPANLSPVLEDAEFPHIKLLVTDITVDHFNRIWIVISRIKNLVTVEHELYYHDLDWAKLEIIPGEENIVSMKADRRNGILYVLTSHTLYRIR